MKIKLGIIFIFFLFVGLRSYGLGFDMLNSDGGRWHRRSESFLTAIKTLDLAATYRHYQPGVTLMWVNSFVKQALFSYQMLTEKVPRTLENADFFPMINFYSKFANVIVLGVLLLIQMYVISRLFDWRYALTYGVLLSVEPYVLGIDRWFHLTSLETYFGFTSFLVFILWLEIKNIKVLIFSAILFSLAVLSKLTSLILSPLFFVFLVSDCLKTGKYKTLVTFVGVVTLTFVLLFPAIWIRPVFVFKNFYNAIFNAVGDDIRQLQVTGVVSYFYYFIILILKLSPITLGLFMVSLFIKKYSTIKYIFYYLANYILFLSFSVKKIDRYSMVLFPPILLLAAFVFVNLKKNTKIICGILIVFFSLWFYLSYTPVFSSYYSPIFGGTKKALEIGVYENSGEYFADAAYYLNLKGRDVVTAVPNNFESFLYFYEGNLSREYGESVGFLVESLDIDRKIIIPPSNCVYEKSFGADKDVVFVFRCLKQ